jgi:hypothetical protein
MAQGGEAADYYSGGGPQQNNTYYQMQDPANYPQQPPQYDNRANYGPPSGPPPPNGQQWGGEKPTFDQAFKVEKPKFNDIWAGLLVCARILLLRLEASLTCAAHCGLSRLCGGLWYRHPRVFGDD